MGSRGSRGSSSHRNHKHHHNHSSSKSIDLSDLHPPEHRRSHDHEQDAEDEGEDSDAKYPQNCHATSALKPSLPPKPSLVNPPVSFNDSNNKHSESENSSIAASAVVIKDSQIHPGGSIGSVTVLDNGNHHHEGSGTVRRRSRNPRSTNNSRPQSTGDYSAMQKSLLFCLSHYKIAIFQRVWETLNFYHGFDLLLQT